MVITVFMPRKLYLIAKIRSRGAILRNSDYRFKNTVTNPLLVVGDHIYHPNHEKKCLGHFGMSKVTLQMVKAGQVKSNHICFLTMVNFEGWLPGFLVFPARDTILVISLHPYSGPRGPACGPSRPAK